MPLASTVTASFLLPASRFSILNTKLRTENNKIFSTFPRNSKTLFYMYNAKRWKGSVFHSRRRVTLQVYVQPGCSTCEKRFWQPSPKISSTSIFDAWSNLNETCLNQILLIIMKSIHMLITVLWKVSRPLKSSGLNYFIESC